MFLLSLQKTDYRFAKTNHDDSRWSAVHGVDSLIPSYSGNEVIPENKLCTKERRGKNIENFKLPLQR